MHGTHKHLQSLALGIDCYALYGHSASLVINIVNVVTVFSKSSEMKMTMTA